MAVDGDIVMTCEFCNYDFRFPRQDVRGAGASPGADPAAIAAFAAAARRRCGGGGKPRAFRLCTTNIWCRCG